MTGTINLASNENDLTNDAGFYRTASLGDYVWEDLNRDGQQQLGEPGIPGVLVSLYADANTDGAPDGPALDTETTDGTGFYQFTNLTPGDYIVGFGTPATYLTTLSNQGPDGTDSDNVGGLTGTINLISNENDLTNDAGFYRTASLGDYVWEDLERQAVRKWANREFLEYW